MSNQPYRSGIPDIPESNRRTIDFGPSSKPLIVNYRVGDWLPQDQRLVERYISELLEKVKQDKRPANELTPSVAQFKELVDKTPVLRMGFTQMFREVPPKFPYNLNPELKHQVPDYETMFRMFDYIINHAIPFDKNALVAIPIYAILDGPAGTEAGLATFLMPEVNRQFKNMFADWAKFLSSSDSRQYLTTEAGGWLSAEAHEVMPNFADTYECDPTAPHWGFQSWDDFFTRKFRNGARPVKFPDPEYADIITNACESEVYKISTDIKEQDDFWLKGQPYSLRDMINNDPYTGQFIGGSIYQAYLSVFNFHRWVSPVSGTIDRIEMIEGTYYADSPAAGQDESSQGYMTNVATRAIIWIKCDNPEIGLMGFIGVGMSEVSTCEVTVKQNQRVEKGHELGMFHYGGSTHCLIFRKRVDIHFLPEIKEKVLLNQQIATVGKGGSRTK
ncbi:phosphatidylserine decarboxylase [Rhizoctonia solani]|uniref:Phosphatidylserine decarboxylase n=1 Tax=Rhizoctonia solani TaxID=456999 RepID=A0A0K6GJ87_9AGAM|nr:unnamed protein product [Rhizoctonia solani]CUA78506.1 phosphatidylserine decarboxylase [Rhizoctonia solani]